MGSACLPACLPDGETGIKTSYSPTGALIGAELGNFTPAGQLRLGEGDRPDCNRLSPRLRSSLSNYGRASSLESEHAEEDLTDKTWFFDSIPKQNARELLREFGKERGFLIRYSDKGNQYTMLWLTQKNS